MANQVVGDGGGLRYNAGKVDFSLIPPEWEEALATVLTRGAAKYARNNFLRGMPWSTMVGCARRHMRSFALGEKYDPESGCHHLAAAAWNLLALMSYDIRGLGTDDLLATTHQMLDAVAQAPGPALQAIIDKKATEAAPKPKPTIAELEAILREGDAYDVEPEQQAGLAQCRFGRGSPNRSAPVDDAFVAVGAERFSDQKIQTIKSLAQATAEFHKGHGDGDDNSGPFDSDCTCRSTLLEKACAEHGCGFCTASQHMRSTG